MRQRSLVLAAVVSLLGAPGCGEGAGGSVQNAPDASPRGDASLPTTDGSVPVPSDPSGPAPPLKPRVLLATYVGGAGNQYLRSARIDPDGAVFAAGDGFSVRYDAALTSGIVEGDSSRDDGAPFTDQPPLRKQPNTSWTVENGATRVDDPRSGLSYFLGDPAGLQQPSATDLSRLCDRRPMREGRLRFPPLGVGEPRERSETYCRFKGL